jgi:GNAT superfamily N-acetyltransferase
MARDTRSETSILIRETRPGDGAALAAMVRELAEFERLAHECRITPEAAELAMTGAEPGVQCWVAVACGEPVGYAVTYRTFSTFLGRHGLYLEDLYVRPSHRGRGVGLALLQTVETTARDGGAGRLEWTALTWNTRARDFYKRFGASELPEWVLNRMTLD